MKHLSLLFGLLLTLQLQTINAQCITDVATSYADNENASMYFHLQGGGLAIDPAESRAYFGISARILMSEYFSLNYSINFGKGYGHLPVFGGGFLSGAFASSLDSDEGACLALLLILLPEGFSLHLPISERVKLSPYINFMGSEYYNNIGLESSATSSPRGAYNLGTYLDINWNDNGLIISPFAEYGGLYNFPVKNLRAGIAIGFFIQ